MIEVKNLTRIFSDGPEKSVQALNVQAFKMEDGEKVALVGASGSGKTTFLHCLSALLSPTSGTICINGQHLENMTMQEKNIWRSEKIGYIFQKSLLIPYLTVEENIGISADMAKKSKNKKEIGKWLSKVGLSGYEKRKPDSLSVGEQQRVAFVRAIIREPLLILADEPTASLDKENSENLMKLLFDYQEKNECMLLCATHDIVVQKRFKRQFLLERGGVICI